jgi:hypothetical protein
MAAITYTSTQVLPNTGKKIVYVTGTSAANNDTITVAELTVVENVLSNFATDGTAGTHTITGTSNVVTMTNGGTKTWKVIVSGY